MAAVQRWRRRQHPAGGGPTASRTVVTRPDTRWRTEKRAQPRRRRGDRPSWSSASDTAQASSRAKREEA